MAPVAIFYGGCGECGEGGCGAGRGAAAKCQFGRQRLIAAEELTAFRASPERAKEEGG